MENKKVCRLKKRRHDRKTLIDITELKEIESFPKDKSEQSIPNISTLSETEPLKNNSGIFTREKRNYIL